MHQSIQHTSNQECTTEGRPASDPECTTKGRPTAAPGPAAACAALPPPPAAAAAPLPGTAGGAGCGLRAARAPATPPSRRSPGGCERCVCGGYGVVCVSGVEGSLALLLPQLCPRPLTGAHSHLVGARHHKVGMAGRHQVCRDPAAEVVLVLIRLPAGGEGGGAIQVREVLTNCSSPPPACLLTGS